MEVIGYMSLHVKHLSNVMYIQKRNGDFMNLHGSPYFAGL